MAPSNRTDDIVCYSPTMITTNGVWQGDSPLDFSFPLFLLQLMVIVVTTRILVFLLRPIRQPRVVAEIIGGIILGPSVLGRSKHFALTIFPLRSVMVLETMSNIGLLYFLFLIGVEMDIAVIKRTGRKAISVALGGMLLPFLTGCVFTLIHPEDKHVNRGSLVVYLGTALAVTAFPVLARVLAELKLLNTEIGRVAMSSALINDIFAWVLLVLAITLAEAESGSGAFLGVLLSSTTFVVICIFVVRPAINWKIKKTPEGEEFGDLFICTILTGVLIAGFVTDVCGTHSIFGAFVLGLIIPNGPLGVTLVEKLEDFVSGLLVPLFFAISGLKTNLNVITGADTWIFLALFVSLGGVGKVVGTTVIAYFHGMCARDGFTLGFLMNTKGLIEMIILNVGRDQNIFDDESFAVLVLTSVVITAFVTPIVTAIYRPSRKSVEYKQRALQRSKPDADIRILTCIHTPRNVPTIVNLLEATHPTKKSPISVYAIHLLELTDRTSAMLMISNSRSSKRPALHRTQAQSDHIMNAFENYGRYVENVSVEPLTVISPYSSMHEDVCNIAEDNRVAFIVLPFHKQQTVDGGMEATNPSFRAVNKKILEKAPCSVGILIDRGLTGSTKATNEISHHTAVLFFGGPDDREALAYAWRMSNHPGISLNVFRFIAREDAAGSQPDVGPTGDARVLTVVTDVDNEKQFDEEYIDEFRTKTADNDSVTYKDMIVNNGEETMAAVRSLDGTHDLFIVGRGNASASPLTAGFSDWSECSELGAIGDLLASSDFAASASVLVVQQYVWAKGHGAGTDSPEAGGGGGDDQSDPWQHVSEWKQNKKEKGQEIL